MCISDFCQPCSENHTLSRRSLTERSETDGPIYSRLNRSIFLRIPVQSMYVINPLSGQPRFLQETLFNRLDFLKLYLLCKSNTLCCGVIQPYIKQCRRKELVKLFLKFKFESCLCYFSVSIIHVELKRQVQISVSFLDNHRPKLFCFKFKNRIPLGRLIRKRLILQAPSHRIFQRGQL